MAGDEGTEPAPRSKTKVALAEEIPRLGAHNAGALNDL